MHIISDFPSNCTTGNRCLKLAMENVKLTERKTAELPTEKDILAYGRCSLWSIYVCMFLTDKHVQLYVYYMLRRI